MKMMQRLFGEGAVNVKKEKGGRQQVHGQRGVAWCLGAVLGAWCWGVVGLQTAGQGFVGVRLGQPEAAAAAFAAAPPPPHKKPGLRSQDGNSSRCRRCFF